MDPGAQPTCNSTTALAPEVPFIPFLAGLTAWALLKLAAEFIVQRMNPQFFEDLKMDVRRRYDLYFGTWLGIIFKAVSITACTASLFTVSADTDIAGLVRPLNTAEQWCWGCRAVLYIQELPHISSIPELVIHHLLSVGAMISILAFNIPRRQMYVAWAGLWSEFVNSARRLFKMHGKLSQRLSWWLGSANFLLLVAFRVTGCFFAVVWTLQSGTRGMSLIIDIGSWTIYFVYMLQVSVWEAYRTKLVVVDLRGRPAKITIAEKWNISLYGIVMGLAFVCTKLSALLMYEVYVQPLTSVGELQSIAWATLQAVLAGMVGGYITVPMGPRSFVLSGKEKTSHQVKQSSMVGGFLSAAAMLAVSPTIASSIDKRALLACMVLSWPLLDAIGYIGYYLEGVGSGARQQASANSKADDNVVANTSHIHLGEKSQLVQATTTATTTVPSSEEEEEGPGRPILPLQLVGSLLSGILYISLLTAVLAGVIDNHYKAALLAFGMRTTVRRVILPRRKDITLRTAQIPLLASPVELHRIWSLATVIFSITALLLIDISANTTVRSNPTFTVLGFTLSSEILTPLKWSGLIGLVHISFELITDMLSRPAPSASRRRHGGSSSSKDGAHKREAAGGSATNKRTGGGGGGGGGREKKKTFQTLLNPKVIASAAGAGLVLLVILAVYSDSMPKVITSVEQARTVGGGGAGAFVSQAGNGTVANGLGGGVGVGVGHASRFHFLLDVVSSWQFVVSTFGVAVLPVVIVQLVN